MQDIIKQLIKDNDIDKFINSFNNIEKNSISIDTNLCISELINLINSEDINSDLYEEAAIKLILNKEKQDPFYSNHINAFKNGENECVKKLALMIIRSQLFTSEYEERFYSIAIGKLLEEILNEKEFKECKEIIFKLHLDIILKFCSIDSIPCNEQEDLSDTFNHSLYYNLKYLLHCYFGREMFDILIQHINSNLSNRYFIYKNKTHLFSEIKIDFSNDFKILTKIDNYFVNIKEVNWII